MATKSLSSLVNDQPTRQITLPNPDAVSHAAGTRGVLCKNIFKNGTTEWGFTPIANKGLARTYSQTNINDKWAIGQPAELSLTGGAGTTATCRTASNGDLIVFALIDPQIGSETSNTYLMAFAFDGSNGDYITSAATSSTAYQYDAGTPENEMEMRCYEPKADWFVCAFTELDIGAKNWVVAGINYNTGTQTFSTSSTGASTTCYATTLNTGCEMVVNNAATTMHFWFATNNERGQWAEFPITGSAGAWTIGTMVAKLANTWNDGYEVGANMTPGCEETRAFRLSTDKIICFGSQISGTATNVDNTSGTTYAINILSSDALTIDHSYHFVGETPASTITNKFYYHQVLFAFEIASNSFIVLTRCGTTRFNATRGTEDYWPDNNGISHVRATHVVVNPADHTLTTNADLGYFESWLFEGLSALKFQVAEDIHNRTTVMDYWHDSTNECVYLFYGTHTARLNFTTSYAATDNANSDIVLSPYGPKKIGVDAYISTAESYGAGAQLDEHHEWELFHQWRGKVFFDSTNKQMWHPCSLNYDNGAHSCQPGLLMWDCVQNTGTNIEVNVVTANATEVQGICSVPLFANPGLPTGTIGGVLMDGQEYLAISDDQILTKIPTQHLTDLLILSRPLYDASDNESIAFHPPGAIMHPLGGTNLPAVYQVKKDWMDSEFAIGDEHDQQYMVAFHSDGIDTDQFNAGYEGALWMRKNVTTPLLFYIEGGGATAHEGCIQIVSEGWWIAGSYRSVNMDRTGTIGNQHTFVLGPSSKIEVNCFINQIGSRAGWKFLRHGVDRLVY